MKTLRCPHIFFPICLSMFLILNQGCREAKDTQIISKLDVLPNDDQVEYSPADGDTVKVNPPPFTWLPVRKNISDAVARVKYSDPEDKVWVPQKDRYSYTLQISRDNNFTSDVITKTGIDISTDALDTTLEPGEWYWRYGVEDGETTYSKARRFIVPSDARKRPFPKDIREVINPVPKSRPRLFVHEQEIKSYRERALKGDLKQTVSEIRNDIAKHIGEDLPPEPQFGPEYEEPSWWRFIWDTVLPPCDMMESFGLVYLLTGDEKYGQEAKRRVLYFSKWDPDGPTSDRGHDEASMRILAQGTRAYDWTYELFTPEEREIVNKSMIRRATQFYERLKYRTDKEYHVYNRGSHEERVTGFLGEAAIAYMDETDQADDWLKYVLTIHWNVYPAWGKEDGAWHQGPGYWTFYHFRLLHFITALKKATGVNLMEKEFFQNTPYYILYTNPPYARMSPFGDDEHNPPHRTGKSHEATRAELMYAYASLLQDPYIRWYPDYVGASHGNNILGIILKDDDLEGRPPYDLPQTRYFPGVGLASLHTDFGHAKEDIHFLFHSDPYGGVSHGHPDQNAFTLEAFGEALAIASGYYPGYGTDHHVKWQRETKSSNSITIDGGKGQKGVAAAKGKVVTFENRDLYDYILGDAAQAYMGLLNKFHRHIIHIRPGVFLMFDDVEAPGPVTFEWWLHALSEMRVNEADKSILISQGNVRLKVKFLQAGDLTYNQFSVFPDPPEMLGHLDLPGQINKDQYHLTASTASKRNKAKFITLLVPYKNGKERNVSVDGLVEEENNVSMELNVDGKRYQVTFLPEVSVKEVGY